jgi:3-dehydroquinate synthase
MIRRSAVAHLEHIATSGDPFELGSARPLDYGHWAAHKLESLTAHALRHGEAVAIGMALDARYACEVGMLEDQALERIARLLRRLGLPLWHPALSMRDERGRLSILMGLEEFREHLGGELTVRMLSDLGRSADVGRIDTDAMERAIAWLKRSCA